MQKNKLIKLFTSMLYISAFTFGGGFVIVTLMKQKFVDELHWLTEEDMLDMTALAQSAPGAIAVNASMLVGRRIAGGLGMAVAALATVIPPVVILSVISLGYKAFADNEWVAAALSGMQAGVAAVLCNVVWNMGQKVVKEKNVLSYLIMAGAFGATLAGVNVIIVILCAAGLGALRGAVERRRGGSKA